MTDLLKTQLRVNLLALNYPGSVGVSDIATPIVVRRNVVLLGVTGTPFSYKVLVSGGQAPYQFTLSGMPLRTGLTLNPATGELSGIPLKAISDVVVQVIITDARGNTASAALKLRISGDGVPPPPVEPPPVDTLPPDQDPVVFWYTVRAYIDQSIDKISDGGADPGDLRLLFDNKLI